MPDGNICHTRTRMRPVDVSTVVDVDIVIRLMTNVVSGVQLGVVRHTARDRSIGVGAVDKVIAINVACVQTPGTGGRQCWRFGRRCLHFVAGYLRLFSKFSQTRERCLTYVICR